MLGCHCIREWGGFCKVHKRVMGALSETWQIVLAAGELNNQLVPCDVDRFLEFYLEHAHFFRELVATAFMKEPASVRVFKEALRGIYGKTGVDNN